jgi:2-succinyl-6-hydroxy-2,4-cyclohexadiene-1-carboxylate synthase
VIHGLARSVRVLAVDLLGHGASDRPDRAERYDIREICADLGELLRERGVASAVWIGYSMGARIALGAAVLQPAQVTALVLEGGSPGLEATAERTTRIASDAVLAAQLESQGIEAFVSRWMSLPRFATQRALPEGVLEAERARRLTNDPRALAACLRGLGTGSQPSFWKPLSEVEVPTLLLAGEYDTLFREVGAAMAAVLPAARTGVVRGAGHATHLERAEGYLSAILPFVKQHAA